MENATERISKREQMAKDGTFAENYTQEGWFCKVKPAFGIAKVKFTFVKKGTHAEEAFDVYMDIDDMIIWSEDIHNKDFFRILEAEAKAGEKYPKQYKITTGESASKSVGFMVSSTGQGYVINGKTFKDGKNIYANVPVDRKWIRKFAFWFDKCLEQSKWAERMAEKTVNASSKYRETLTQEDEESGLQNDATAAKRTDTERQNTSGAADKNTQRKPFSVSSSDMEQAKQTNPGQNDDKGRPAQEKNTATTDNQGQIKTFKVKVVQSFVDMQNGCKAMNVCRENGEKIPVIVPKNMIGKEGWTEFSGMCSIPGAIITIKGCISSGRIILNSFSA